MVPGRDASWAALPPAMPMSTRCAPPWAMCKKEGGEVQLHLQANMRCGNRPVKEGRCSGSSSVFQFRPKSCEFIVANHWSCHQPCQLSSPDIVDNRDVCKPTEE